MSAREPRRRDPNGRGAPERGGSGREYPGLALKLAVAHSVTYFVIGAAAYWLLTRDLYVGPEAPFRSFMRTEGDPELWSHVMATFFPGQILRGLVMAAVLLPLLDTLRSWSWRRRAFVLTGLYLGFGFWAATVAAPGTIEGLIYLRPEITWGIHLKVQPEIVLQGCAFAGWLAAWIGGTAPERTCMRAEGDQSAVTTRS